jgi:hypothetical protein
MLRRVWSSDFETLLYLLRIQYSDLASDTQKKNAATIKRQVVKRVLKERSKKSE